MPASALPLNRSDHHRKPARASARQSVAEVYALAGLDPAPIFAAKAAASELVIDMLDIIGEGFFFEGITSRTVAEALSGSKAKTVRLRIHSPGGDAVEGTAIRSLLRAHAADTGARIVAEVHGMAASAATMIAMAGDDILIAPDAVFMVHEVSTFAGGFADDLRDVADMLDKFNAAYRTAYAQRTGKSEDEVADLMAAETWFTAEEAIAEGFATALLGEEHTADTAKARANPRMFAAVSSFEHAPEDLIEQYRSKTGEQLIAAMSNPEPLPKTEQNNMKREALAAALQLKPTATEEEIMSTIVDIQKQAATALHDAETYRQSAEDAKAQAKEASAELASLKAEKTQQDVAHRIDALRTSGKVTEAKAKTLVEKFEARAKRGQLAVDLFIEDLAELEGAEPSPLVKASGLDDKDAPAGSAGLGVITEVTPEIRAKYPASVSDKIVLDTENRFRAAKRDALKG